MPHGRAGRSRPLRPKCRPAGVRRLERRPLEATGAVLHKDTHMETVRSGGAMLTPDRRKVVTVSSPHRVRQRGTQPEVLIVQVIWPARLGSSYGTFSAKRLIRGRSLRPRPHIGLEP